MPVLKGKVYKRGLVIQVEGARHYMPKGCDPIIGPQLQTIAGQDVEVLMAKDVVLAVRPVRKPGMIKIPIIICYLCPPFKVFDPDIMRRIEPVITKSLLESGYLDQHVVAELDAFKAVR